MRLPDRGAQGKIALAAAAILTLAVWVAYPHARALWHQHKLVDLLDGTDVRQRERAAVRLAAIGDQRAIPALVRALDIDGGIDTRSGEAAAALCTLGGVATVRALDAELHRPGADASLIIQVMACIDLPDARAALATSLQSQNEILFQTTTMMLSGSRDPGVVALLLDAYQRANRERKMTFLASLADPAGRRLDARLVRVLTKAAGGADEAVREVASDTLRWNELNQAGSTGIWASEQAETEAELEAASRRAKPLLIARQARDGIWFTSRTLGLDAEQAIAERNTYLTPLIVDMLHPVAAKANLGGSLARARRHIGSEIEESGLVRYYGSAAGAAGRERICAIAFDADDTALAWRIAPKSDPRMLKTALANLRQFRAPNGLYRTWISRDDGLECVDRGSDPNPTDVGIQMHLLMFLAQVSPAEGRELCAALGKSIDDDRIWVYYRQEPLIPMLRQPDIAKTGCAVRIPEARIRTDVAGQGKWLAVGRALLRLQHPDAGPGDREAARRLLQRLAQADFAAIRRSPPLLYQNDATGTVPAFYWAPAFGYALWLRLYHETVRGPGSMPTSR